MHSGCCNENICTTIGNKTAGEYHIDAVTESNILGDIRVVFIHICRLSGQRTFIYL